MKNVTQILVVALRIPSEQSDAVTLCQGPHSVFRIHRFLSRRMFTDQRVWFRMIGSELVPGYRLSRLSFSIVTIYASRG